MFTSHHHHLHRFTSHHHPRFTSHPLHLFTSHHLHRFTKALCIQIPSTTSSEKAPTPTLHLQLTTSSLPPLIKGCLLCLSSFHSCMNKDI
uniref:Uncharacterized protein n=1 Tax=Helianthus annuus TaxID=4232 RepID=A0A251UUI5_HELAN